MKYKVLFPTGTIEKKFLLELKKIPSENIRYQIKAMVLGLADDPRPYGQLKIKPPIEVYTYIAHYRLRVGNYRILYDVDDFKKIVWVLVLRKRDEKTYN